MKPANPFERHARQTKAIRIADAIWANLFPSDRVNPNIEHVVGRMTMAERDGWAQEAGAKTPSAETWKQVTDRIGKMVEREMCRPHEVAS